MAQCGSVTPTPQKSKSLRKTNKTET